MAQRPRFKEPGAALEEAALEALAPPRQTWRQHQVEEHAGEHGAAGQAHKRHGKEPRRSRRKRRERSEPRTQPGGFDRAQSAPEAETDAKPVSRR